MIPIKLSPAAWGVIGASILVGLLSLALYGRGLQLDAARSKLVLCEASFASFQAEMARLGREAEKRRKETDDANRDAKQKADGDLRAAQSDLARARRELRDERTRSGGSLVPSPSPGSSRPDLACFDRADLDRALSRFEEDVEGFIGEGAAAVIELDSAKRWNQERK